MLKRDLRERISLELSLPHIESSIIKFQNYNHKSIRQFDLLSDSATESSLSRTYHFNSNVNFCLKKNVNLIYLLKGLLNYLVDGLYLAHTITSLNKNKCLNFLFPSIDSIMKLSLTNLL